MVGHLNHPQSNIQFKATPAFFIGPFDVYDREESIGRDLNTYDPNDPVQLQRLFDVYFFPSWTENGATVAHKRALAEALIAALRDPHYNFADLLKDDSDHFSLPSTWEFRDPRQFFYGAYLALVFHWSDELLAAGFSLPVAEGLRYGG
jgi:hypothetical protein